MAALVKLDVYFDAPDVAALQLYSTPLITYYQYMIGMKNAVQQGFAS